jgi:hypothetical protein
LLTAKGEFCFSFIYLTSSRKKQDKNNEVERKRQKAAVAKLD